MEETRLVNSWDRSRVQMEKLGLERRIAEHPGPDAGRYVDVVVGAYGISLLLLPSFQWKKQSHL